MSRISAGLLLYRVTEHGVEVFLVHPGGPYFAAKDAGVWSIPKGELDTGEDPLLCAKRELQEETGIVAPDTRYIDLGTIKQKAGKLVRAWACEGEWDGTLVSNSFELEWPPRSGRTRAFPEVDRAGFFSTEIARVKLNPAQVPLIDRLLHALG